MKARSFVLRGALIAASLACAPCVLRADAPGLPVGADAEKLVEEALRAELDGNVAQRRVLLNMAVDAAPDYAPARWQSGQVRAGDEWLPIEKAQAAAAGNPQRAQYNTLRAAADESLAAQLALARWCRKNSLPDEARFHWRSVLARDPNNQEALRALDVRWYAGRLLKPAEIDRAKAAARARKAAVKEFAPRMARWERMLAAGDLKSRNEALDEIRALRNVAVLPAIEEVTLDRELATNAEFENCLWISEALLAALNETPGVEATHSLVRHALFSPLRSIRNSAVEAIKKRPMHDYVPQLLAALAMPIESSYRVVTDADGSVHYFHSLYREGQNADWSFEGRLSAMQHDLQGPTFVRVDDRIRGEVTDMRLPARTNRVVQAEMAAVADKNQRKFAAKAGAAEQRIATINQATTLANQWIVALLAATTGQELGDSPHLWWDWWERYNEYSADGETPVYENSYAESTHRYYRAPESNYYRINPPPPPPPPGGYPRSCFAAGTPVWTNTGLREIESLQTGDLVLSQNTQTGELTYKPVVGRTVRPPSPIRAITVEGDEIETTLGHPFWVAGVGWRMAKELADGATLHGVHGGATIDAIEERKEAEAYNLIVADFATYFVGKTGLLVHDNTPRGATTTLLPGLQGMPGSTVSVQPTTQDVALEAK